MRKTFTTMIAAVIIVLLIVVLNSFCAGCVYAQSTAADISVLVAGLASGHKIPSSAGHLIH